MQIKVTLSRKNRRKILGAHQLIAAALAVYAVAFTSGWQLWLLLAFAAEAYVFTAIYAVAVAPAPRPRATTATPRQRAAGKEQTSGRDTTSADTRPNSAGSKQRRATWSDVNPKEKTS